MSSNLLQRSLTRHCNKKVKNDKNFNQHAPLLTSVGFLNDPLATHSVQTPLLPNPFRPVDSRLDFYNQLNFADSSLIPAGSETCDSPQILALRLLKWSFRRTEGDPATGIHSLPLRCHKSRLQPVFRCFKRHVSQEKPIIEDFDERGCCSWHVKGLHMLPYFPEALLARAWF